MYDTAVESFEKFLRTKFTFLKDECIEYVFDHIPKCKEYIKKYSEATIKSTIDDAAFAKPETLQRALHNLFVAHQKFLEAKQESMAKLMLEIDLLQQKRRAYEKEQLRLQKIKEANRMLTAIKPDEELTEQEKEAGEWRRIRNFLFIAA